MKTHAAALSLLSILSSTHAESLRGGIPDDEVTKFHQSGFGGKYNIGHFPDTRPSRRHLIKVPQSKNEHAIPSITEQNIENVYGHWYHDEHHSPFASHIYDRPQEELDEEQAKFLRKMDQVRKEWGAWEFQDDHEGVRPVVNFDHTPYRDMENKAMERNSWQKNNKYTMDFIAEGKKLVDRVLEGVYAEYGHPTKGLSEDEIKERDELFGIQFMNETDTPPHDTERGIAYMSPRAFDMLAKKLLHSMITNDEFYVVLGGHSAAAGHGNNFHQTKAMSFHLLMEPVFQKLGMRLISKNLAMGGLGTIHFSFGQGSLYGERDLIFWDSSMTENDAGSRDFYNKQALLNGERVPILMASKIYDLEQEAGGYLWHGDILRGDAALPITEDMEQALEVPYAARYMKCGPIGNELNLCGDKGNPNTYNSQCWVDRTDYTPVRKQQPKTPGRAGWHPGFRQHQWEGRKYALTVLHALKKAFEKWENGIEKDNWPLREHHWHVGEDYKVARQTLINSLTKEDREESECEKHLGNWKLPTRICHTGMSGMTEFSPRNLGDKNSIRAHIKTAPNGYKPAWSEHHEYEGFDLMPLTYQIPDGDVDVHAIAIATNYKAPVFEGGDGDDDDKIEEADVGRRALRKSEDFGDQLTKTAEAKAEMKSNEISISHAQGTRVLYDDEVIPGQGWTKVPFGSEPNIGYCDGSTMSFCKRHNRNECLLYGHNDSHGGIAGDGLSGWLVIKIPNLRHGIITAKFEWWSVRDLERTRDWTEVNNGKTNDTTPYDYDTEEEKNLWDGSVEDDNRRLKAKIPDYPEDSKFDFALNGKIFKTMDIEEFDFFKKEMNYNNAHFAIMDDNEMAERDWDGEPAELGIRLRSETKPRELVLNVNHIYYA